jgi:ABC-type lipoprotein export system ATPase subunit
MTIRLEQLKVVFQDARGKDVPVLDIPELVLEDGRRVCLVGGSGSGKTTLLNVIAGITTPTSGTVRHGDVDFGTMSEPEIDQYRAKHIGYVFQSFNLLQALSARENVALAGSFAGRTTAEATKRAQKLLERVDLGHRMGARPGTLSVGEQQRVGIARALINEPKVVLADEPTANLDGKRSDEVLKLLEEVVAEEGATLVLVTHEERVTARFDDVVELEELSQ